MAGGSPVKASDEQRAALEVLAVSRNRGVEAIKASVYAGPPPVKTEAALRVCAPLLEAPVANRANWTIPRLIAEIKKRSTARGKFAPQ
jgi:hypothetical protein